MSEPPPVKRYRMALQRPVMMVMLFLTLAVFGWKSYQQLPINLMPDISYPTLTVRTEYEGAAPEDVEKLVTRPLEETLSIVNGLVEISSISSPGLSEIMLEFTWDSDMNVSLQDVRDRLDLFDPPKEITEKPVILRFDPTLDPVLRVAIIGSDFSHITDGAKRAELDQKELTAIREAAERHLKSDLEAETGIAQVLIKGGREEEIQVLVDAELLKNVGLSLQDVADSLAQQNINLSGGRLREGKTEYLVRTLNEYKDIAAIRESLIGSSKGRRVRLSDVATVTLGQKERETIVHINGREAVAMDVFKDGDANTVEVCDKLKDILGIAYKESLADRIMALTKTDNAGEEKTSDKGGVERLAKTVRSRLPRGAEFVLISDQSRFIKESIRDLQDATIQGGLLALGVLFLFLQELKSTLVIGIAIPISLITAFIPMFMLGISLNVMSLGGLALGVGLLVDNSIVVLESIFRCREEGDSPRDAAERGTHEVAGAVVSATITTVVVFLPIAFVQGVAGQIFGDLGLTVTFSVSASLMVALWLNPMMVAQSGGRVNRTEDVVWLTRLYRQVRENPGTSRSLALRRMFPAMYRSSAGWLRETTHQTFDPTIRAFRLLYQERGLWAVIRALYRIAVLPLVAPFFFIEILLKLFQVVFVTLLFAISLVVLAFLLALRNVFRLVFWLPLTAFEVSFSALRRVYSRALRASVQMGPVVLFVVAILAVHSALLVPTLGRELIPPLKQGEFGIRVEAPPGTRLEEMETRAQAIEDIIRNSPDIASVSVAMGKERMTSSSERAENVAEFTVLVKDPEKNALRQEAIIEDLRQRITNESSDQITFTLPTLFSFKTAVELQICGDDLAELERIGKRVLAAIRDVRGLQDAELSVKKGYPEIIVELDRDLLAAKGLTPIQVAQRLRTEVQGDVATRFSRRGEKIDIRVRADQAKLQGLADLKTVSVVDGNPPIPLSSVATLREQDGPSEIRRINQRQVVVVRGNVEGIDLGAVTREIAKRLETVEKPNDYTFMLGGQNRELQVSYRSLQFALILSLFLVYVTMACQFESITHPALVMFTVPLAFVGVIYVMKWLHMSLSVAVFIGGIILVGIVVDNGIVLVDYANQLRARGRTRRQAIIDAAQIRLRPVLMTAITAVLGLIPMSLYSGEGSELRRPMAITVMAGLTCATVLTLIVIPVVYDMFGGRDKT